MPEDDLLPRVFSEKRGTNPSVLMSTHDIKAQAHSNVMSLSTSSTNFVRVSGCSALALVHVVCGLSKNHTVYSGLIAVL